MSHFFPYIVTGTSSPFFPDYLPSSEQGIVAVGGTLSNDILIEAYSKGYFPWYEGGPVIWFSPRSRLLLRPRNFHFSRSLKKIIRQRRFDVRFDTRFEEVVQQCARISRKNQRGTWINREIKGAYLDLHRSFIAHSVEVYSPRGRLCGGLYGVTLGRGFFGESMFSLVPNASKVALYFLVQFCLAKRIDFIDCQVKTDHLTRLGAEEISRSDFEAELKRVLKYPSSHYLWQIEREIYEISP